MPEIQVQIYQQGSQWVARASNLNMAFVANSREEVAAAVRAALRRCVGETVEIDVVETATGVGASPILASPPRKRPTQTNGSARG